MVRKLNEMRERFLAAGFWGRLKMLSIVLVSLPVFLFWPYFFLTIFLSESPLGKVNLSMRFRVDNMLMESGPDAGTVRELEKCIAKTGMHTSHEYGQDLVHRAYGRSHTIIVRVCDAWGNPACGNSNESLPAFAYTRTQVRMARQCFVLAREQRIPLEEPIKDPRCFAPDAMGYPSSRALWCPARDFSKDSPIEKWF